MAGAAGAGSGSAGGGEAPPAAAVRGVRRAEDGEGGAPGACPSEGNGPCPPCRARSVPRGGGVRGQKPGRGAEKLGAGGGGRGMCGAVRCQLGFPCRDGGEGRVSFPCVRE